MRTIFPGIALGESVEPIKNLSLLAPTPLGVSASWCATNAPAASRTGNTTKGAIVPEFLDQHWQPPTRQLSLVQPGENRFTWSVQNPVDKSLPTEGEAWLDISIDERTRYRDFRSINEDAYCTGEKYNTWNRTPLDRCPPVAPTWKRVRSLPGRHESAVGRRTIYRRYSYW